MFSELWEKVSDVGVFTGSVREWISGISINSVIILIMMIFMIVGAVDKLRGNKLGYGQEFDEGFRAMGPLAIAMAGVVAAAPVLAAVLEPIIVPFTACWARTGPCSPGRCWPVTWGAIPWPSSLPKRRRQPTSPGWFWGR